MIYLDNAATTQVSRAVFEAMEPYYKEYYGNPYSIHGMGQEAYYAVEMAREQVARLLSCKPQNVVFTSGGAEANSMVFAGVQERLMASGKTHIIISEGEHESVWNAAWHTSPLLEVTEIPYQEDGTIDSSELEAAIRPDTGLISIMAVNNETGAKVIDPAELSRIGLKHKIPIHMDMVQAVGTTPLLCGHWDGIAFASVSAHKFHGPKGVGALYVRDGMDITPLIWGSDIQERGLRGGTANVPAIVGMGKAAELAYERFSSSLNHCSALKGAFFRTLCENIYCDEIVHRNGPTSYDLGKILSLTIDGVGAETLVLMMDNAGVCISAGSACHGNGEEPSRTLLSMGLTPEEAKNTVRISFSELNTMDEAVGAAKKMAAIIGTLRNIS